jgi:predicted DNA-binding WGR domain protein
LDDSNQAAQDRGQSMKRMRITMSPMSDVLNSEVHLQRVIPQRNEARFYTLSVEVTLLGGYSCTRTYGRIGARFGRLMIGCYDDLAGAEAALSRMLQAKSRRGYVRVTGTGLNSQHGEYALHR